jgi:hypothetical protein
MINVIECVHLVPFCTGVERLLNYPADFCQHKFTQDVIIFGPTIKILATKYNFRAEPLRSCSMTRTHFINNIFYPEN